MPLTPSAHPQLIDSMHTAAPHDGHLDETAQALLNRIVVRGRLTAAEAAALSPDGAEALQDLLAGGLVAAAGDGYAATDATWLALGLANPPHIAELDHHATTTEGAGVTLTGTGDAGDTITVYAGTVALGSTLVAADGTWQLTVFPPVGEQSLTATQTVNELPHVGLTSGQSKDVEITVLPDAPVISPVATPGPAAPTAPVTLTGTGDAGDTIVLTDGGRRIADTVVAADGTWTLTVSLSPGTHTLAATQSTPCADHHCDPLTSPASSAQTVTVYAPPPAPSLTVPSPANVTAPFTVGGHGVAGDTVVVYDGAVLAGTALVAANGTWSLLLDLPLGPHPLSASQTDPVSTFTGAATATATVTVYATPPAPAIVSVSTPAATTSTTPVTVTGTGVAGDTITLYDGAAARGTAVVAAGGTWTLTIQLGVGVHSLTATQTVAPGVTGPAGAAVSVTVLPPPPAAPTLSAPPLAPVAPLALGGHGVAGDTVTLYDGATAIGTATVAGNGSWSLTVSLALGTHTLAATQTDPVWNLTSALGIAVTVDVVPTPPPPAIVSAVAGHSHHRVSPVTVGGTGVAGETVTLYDGGEEIGTTTVAADGTWTLTVELGDGGHTLTATQALGAGPRATPPPRPRSTSAATRAGGDSGGSVAFRSADPGRTGWGRAAAAILGACPLRSRRTSGRRPSGPCSSRSSASRSAPICSSAGLRSPTAPTAAGGSSSSRSRSPASVAARQASRFSGVTRKTYDHGVRRVLALLPVVLLAAACGGGSKAPATTTAAATTAPAARPVLDVALTAESHNPVVGHTWTYQVHVTDPAGKPVASRIHLQFLFGGMVVGEVGVHVVADGVWKETIPATGKDAFPPAAVGQALVLRATATAKGYRAGTGRWAVVVTK